MKGSRKIGKCIYCGEAEGRLTDEHITPLALNGDRILVEASCETCRNITSGFESVVLNRTLFAARAALSTKTRRPRNRQRTREMLVERDGQIEKVELRWQDHWKVIPLPIFKKPAHLEDRSYSAGIEAISMDLFELGEKNEEVAIKQNADRVLLDNYSPIAFARMIAKMAYGYAVDRYGLDSFEAVYVLPAILGKTDDIGRWVGCDDQRVFRAKRNFFITVGFKIADNELLVRIKLFTLFDGAEYLIVVGRLRESLVGFLQGVGRKF